MTGDAFGFTVRDEYDLKGGIVAARAITAEYLR
jgi:hypothetical protein